MHKKFFLSVGMSLLLLSLLSGCGSNSGKKMREAETFVNQVKSAPAPPAPPLPAFEKITPPSGTVTIPRNPFAPAVNLKQKQPDSNRPKEVLESYALDQLQFVGVIYEKKIIWGLIKTPDGNISRVQIGNYIGQNFGRITNISPTQIQLEETIPDGLGGWTQHPNVLLLTTNTQDHTQ